MSPISSYVQFAAPPDALIVARMVGRLLREIMAATVDTGDTGKAAFDFDLADTTARLTGFLETGKYQVLIARESASPDQPSGFIALYESYALYAGGTFGTIPELFVLPQCRARGIGRMLIHGAKAYAAQKGWTRLEVTTPPLPAFKRTLDFYEKEGFSVSGGRKLKLAL